MTTRTIAIVVTAATAILLCCLIATTVLVAGGATAGCTTPVTIAADAAPRPIGAWDAEQVGNAITIAAVGADRAIPARGVVIALATAMQESGLHNLPGGDRDSVGLFQQRPSQGWGTPDQLHDPTYAAGRFYRALLAVDGWQSMPLTQAAQAVQHSATPDAYAKWEQPARTLLTHLIAGGGPTASTPVGPCLASGDWTAPVHGPTVSGFRPPDRPQHQGIDIAAPKGTTIHAASTGVVTVVACNATLDDGPYPCDADGSPQVLGCGWYLEILHAGHLVTRYCHQLVRPIVAVGQHVAVGQPIGVVGTSGNSSGPHLHFEVHTNQPATPDNAIDPAEFLHQHGVTP
jgi:murein DD-endopeptidase MepM/ murein hydrolase activator NlpD